MNQHLDLIHTASRPSLELSKENHTTITNRLNDAIVVMSREQGMAMLLTDTIGKMDRVIEDHDESMDSVDGEEMSIG